MRKCVTPVSLTALGNLFLFVYRNVIFFIYKPFGEFLYSSLYKLAMHSFRSTLVAHKVLTVNMSLKDKYTHNTCQIYVKSHSKNTQITLESQIFDEKALR